MPEWLMEVSSWVLPVLLAVTLHEAAHGWMAERFGDNTARLMGRVTFNPLRHVDRVGTILLPALLFLIKSPILFGYAKPVPVDFRRLTPPRLGMFMVAIAGVAVNYLQALAVGLLMHLDKWITPEEAPWLFLNLYHALLINCVLIVFNLIPILPLDGGRAVDAFLSGKIKALYARLEPFGIPLVIVLFLVPPLLGSDITRQVLGTPTFWLIDSVFWLTGNTG